MLNYTINRKIITAFSLLVVPCFALQAQQDSISGMHQTYNQIINSLNKEEDVIHILQKIFKIKPKPDTANLKPGKLYLAIVPGIGFTNLNAVAFAYHRWLSRRSYPVR